jgi:hypothetical protein
MLKPLLTMAAAAVLAFCTAMWVHSAHALPLKPPGSDQAHTLKFLIYGIRGGVIITFGTPESGPVVFKDAKACMKAQNSPEAKEVADSLRGQLQARAPEKVYVQLLCLPVPDAAQAERVD